MDRSKSSSRCDSTSLEESSAEDGGGAGGAAGAAARERRRLRRLFFREAGRVRCGGGVGGGGATSSGDADVSAIENERCDLTPGSLEVWLELPDEIKYDPLLAPFKERYEQQHGRLEPPAPEATPSVHAPPTLDGDRTIFSKRGSGLTTIGEASPASRGPDAGLIHDKNKQKENKRVKTSKQKQVQTVCRVLKLVALVACWLLLTVALLLNTEREDVVLHTAVSTGIVKTCELRWRGGGGSADEARVRVELSGPFLAVAGNHSSGQLQVWLHRKHGGGSPGQNSTIWSINLVPDSSIDFSASERTARTLVLPAHELSLARTETEEAGEQTNDDRGASLSLRMHTAGRSIVPLTVSYQLDPLQPTDGVTYAAILLCTLYILIVFEIVNRTLAAILSSSLGVAVLAAVGERPSLPELVSWLDVETLLLLFSMMLLVAILAETGLFDYLAVLAFEMTGGRTWPLIHCLCLFTAVLSTFLDNVTTVLLMTPVTIRLCEVMHLNPVPVLMSMVIFSNVGGAATPVGDPPNVIIASHPAVIAAGINFTTFTMHMLIGIVMVYVQTLLQLRFMFRDMSVLRHSEPGDIQELRQEAAVWRRAAASLSSYSRDEELVRRALQKKVDKLEAMLVRRNAGGGPTSASDPVYCATLAHIKQKYRIRDRALLVKATFCVAFVVLVFFLHAFPVLQRLSLGWTAFLGALLLLLLAERNDLEPILARVEWSTLLFFAALFVLMEALSKLGLIDWIGNLTKSLILQVGEDSRLAVAILLILWVSGVASAFVDNIPLATMMVRVTTALADPAGLGLPLQPLVWALSMGACLGGNGTLIGASANVVCAGVAEQHGYRFTFLQFLRVGFPVMLGNLLVASVYLLLAHCVFTWH